MNQVYDARAQATSVRDKMLAFGKLWQQTLQQPKRAPLPNPARTVPIGRPLPLLRWEAPGPLVLRKQVFRRSFSPALAYAAHSWISSICASAPPKWISFIQVYISFQSCCGPWAISKVKGKWSDETGEIARLTNHQKFSIRVKHFRLMLQQFFRDTEVCFSTATVRPVNGFVVTGVPSAFPLLMILLNIGRLRN